MERIDSMTLSTYHVETCEILEAGLYTKSNAQS